MKLPIQIQYQQPFTSSFMNKIIGIIGLCLLFASCVQMQHTSSQSPNPKTLSLAWNSNDYIPDNYKTMIDSLMPMAIQEFNEKSKHLKFTAVPYSASHTVNFYFSEGKFATKEEITAGYIISGLGILVSPIATWQLSQNQFLIAFWDFPGDKINYKLTTYFANSKKQWKGRKYKVSRGALFKSKNARMQSIANQLHQSILNALKSFDHH